MLKQLSIAIVAISSISGYSAGAVEPGDDCDIPGAYLRDNDTNAAYHLVCDGNQWNLNLTLHKDGPVGIGTMNPSSGLKLDVEGKVGATDYCDENGENCFTAGGGGGGNAAVAGPEGAIQFNNSGALSGDASFVYTSAGVVKLTTASASAVGQVVKGSPAQSANLQEWQISDGSLRTSIDASGRLITRSPDAATPGLVAYANTSGYANPAALFQNTAGGSSTGAYIRVQGARVSYVHYARQAGSPSYSQGVAQASWRLIQGANIRANANSVYYVDPEGRFHVNANAENAAIYNVRADSQMAIYGTTRPSLTVQSAIQALSGNGTNVEGTSMVLVGGRATGNAAGGSIMFQTSDVGASGTTLQTLSTKMIITPEGQVGIGKSDPAYPLDVAGDIALTGQIHDVSDRRLKSHIKPLDAGQLKKLLTLQGVSFVMQESERTELGLIAQDVEPHFPELVQTRSDGMKTLSYLGFIAPMIEAFKEQQTQLELLQEQVDLLQTQLRQISSQDHPE